MSGLACAEGTTEVNVIWIQAQPAYVGPTLPLYLYRVWTGNSCVGSPPLIRQGRFSTPISSFLRVHIPNGKTRERGRTKVAGRRCSSRTIVAQLTQEGGQGPAGTTMTLGGPMESCEKIKHPYSHPRAGLAWRAVTGQTVGAVPPLPLLTSRIERSLLLCTDDLDDVHPHQPRI